MGLKDTTNCLGYQQITSLSSSTGLTVPTLNGIKPTFALLQCEAQSVRWRDDGTAPTATVGMILNVGDPPYPYDGDLSAIRFIESTASGKLNVSYYA